MKRDAYIEKRDEYFLENNIDINLFNEKKEWFEVCVICNSMQIIPSGWTETKKLSSIVYINRNANYLVIKCDYCISKLRAQLELDDIIKRMNAIEVSLQAHASGVQNVYNEFNQCKKCLNNEKLEEVIENYTKLKNSLDEF